MKLNLGRWKLPPTAQAALRRSDLSIDWDEEQLINGHILIAGGSGTGKTHNIRKFCREFVRSATGPLRIHVFDVHDDIAIAGASEIVFSEASDVGLNPLVIDPNIHTGGVRKAIQNLIQTINKTSRQLGDRQEAALRSLLEELYTVNGFHPNKPDTWRPNPAIHKRNGGRFPNIDDLYRWGAYKYKQLFVGGSTQSASALDKVNRESSKLQRYVAERAKEKKENEEIQDTEDMKSLKESAIEAYSDFVRSIKTGKEFDDLLKYDSKNTLKSVLDRIENLQHCGVFRNQGLNFDPHSTVWRYRLKHLGPEEKKMFVHFRLRELYLNALRRGEQDHIVEVIVIDESNMFMDDSKDNIISIMANEIRKFGTALVCASQSFTHFSDDFLASAGTKMILGIDEMFWDKTCRQLQLKKEWLANITPRRSALINMKRTVQDDLSGFKWFLPDLSP